MNHKIRRNHRFFDSLKKQGLIRQDKHAMKRIHNVSGIIAERLFNHIKAAGGGE